MQVSHHKDTGAPPIPPPLIVLGATITGVIIDRLVGAKRSPSPFLRIIGYAVSILGGSLMTSAAFAMLRSGNSPDPRTPVQRLNQGGVFRWSRNPIYLGMLLNQLGVGLVRRSLATVGLVPVTLALLVQKVIAGEETYLASRFGDEYAQYCEQVPRWFRGIGSRAS